MKLSEITTELAANYLRLNYASMTTAEKTELGVMVTAAQAFIKSYTGLTNVAPEDEAVGTGDGVETHFTLAYHPSSGQVVSVDGVAKTETTHYTMDDATGVITFLTAPAYGAEITASYSAVPSDAFDDLVMAAYVLIQDMYDNRAFSIDKSNINQVVDMILGLHRVNLL